nr:glycoside hydrolase family 10 protein [Cyanobium sp. Morenito 9A2]
MGRCCGLVLGSLLLLPSALVPASRAQDWLPPLPAPPPPTGPAPEAPPPPGPAPLTRAEIRGVWLTSNDMAVLRDQGRLQATIDQLSALHFNTLYPVVWNSGFAYYPSAVTQRRGIQSFTYLGLQGQDLLADISARARQSGLLVIPWFEFGFMAPPSSELVAKNPAWLTRKRDGGTTSITAAGEVVWLNPFHPDVQAFITELVLEIVGSYDVDGIQFDDHMVLPRDFGYDPFTVALYRKEAKKDPPANPQDPAWVTWRAGKITAFMARLRQAVRERKPNAIVSISPNYYDFAYRLQLQDWLTWVRRGIVDEVVVQLYRPDLASFESQLERPELAESQRLIPTAIGIMAGQRSSPVPLERIEAQTRAARGRGIGAVYFYLESLWRLAPEPAPVRLDGFRELFPTPAPRRQP